MKLITSIMALLYVLSGFFPASTLGDCADQTTGQCCCGPRVVEVQQASSCCGTAPEPEAPLFQKAHNCFCQGLPTEDTQPAPATVPSRDSSVQDGALALHTYSAPERIIIPRSMALETHPPRPTLHPPPVRIQQCSFRL